METLDRKIAPSYKPIESVELIEPKKITLDNGVELYAINAGSQEIVKIELIFPAGNTSEDKPLIGYTTNHMLKEGTKTKSSSEIAETLDYYGAFLENEYEKDNASLVLYSLNKHLPSTIDLFREIVTAPIFPEKELNVFLQNSRQKHIVNLSKVDALARYEFAALIFGDKHPYGAYPKVEDYDNVIRQDLIDFHEKNYQLGNCKILVSGNFNDKVLKLIIDSMSGGSANGKQTGKKALKVPEISANKKFINKQEAIQSAIRLGRIMVNKTNPEYQDLQILNAILGGYFGSRLMTNIREDKGYTYGIGSAVVSLQNSGYFFISTEVGKEVSKNALSEIYYELNRLRNELIPEEELELVKNYLLGVFLRSVDGPFALAEKLKGLLEYGLDYSYYDRFINRVKNITSEELKLLANKYLQEEDLSELVVGAEA